MPAMAVAMESLASSSSSSTAPIAGEERKPYYYRVSPSLYAAAPSSDPSSIVDSSPYVLNHKRRHAQLPLDHTEEKGEEDAAAAEEAGLEIGSDDRWIGDEGSKRGIQDEDDFFDPRDSMSVASSSDAEDTDSLCRTGSRNRSSLTNNSEFYDVSEDFLSDGSMPRFSPSFRTNNQFELHGLRQNVLEEIENRKRAEEALLYMQNQWHAMEKSLQMGLSFPEIHHSGDLQNQLDPVAICRDIIVEKFVYEAIERGLARAETEAVLEEVIESKNHEISRLRDRLQYYEAMNREMSQRNQEGVELARQERMRRKRRQRWIWGFIGLSVSIGASLLIAHSYWPTDSDASSAEATAAAVEELGETEPGTD